MTKNQARQRTVFPRHVLGQLRGPLLVLALAALCPAGCGDDVLVGELAFVPTRLDAGPCQVTLCQSHVYACGDCADNDQDGLVDSLDPDCLGPCHNSEDTFFSSIPGGNAGNCVQDCYFDQDTGGGNDDCVWSLSCDPNPVDASCDYRPDTTLQQSGQSMGCDALRQKQTEQCLNACGPLTPNGCDCFGCCTIVGAPTPVYLGSTVNGTPTCDLAHLSDPDRCHPCTQVEGCLNDCGPCELCLGKDSVPDNCASPDGGTEPTEQCTPDLTPCGLPGQEPCPNGYYCITGCCIEVEIVK